MSVGIRDLRHFSLMGFLDGVAEFGGSVYLRGIRTKLILELYGLIDGKP
jgi:hypothetical protein